MGGSISKMAKQELVATIRDRYQQASKKDKGRILDEFTAVTGHHRKHGIRLLSGTASTDGKQVVVGASTTRPYAKRSSWSGRHLTASAVNGSRRRCPTSWTPWSGMSILVSILSWGNTFSQPAQQRWTGCSNPSGPPRVAGASEDEGRTWGARSRCALTTTGIGRCPAFWKSTW